jgi:hypothetical protein
MALAWDRASFGSGSFAHPPTRVESVSCHRRRRLVVGIAHPIIAADLAIVVFLWRCRCNRPQMELFPALRSTLSSSPQQPTTNVAVGAS